MYYFQGSSLVYLDKKIKDAKAGVAVMVMVMVMEEMEREWFSPDHLSQ